MLREVDNREMRELEAYYVARIEALLRRIRELEAELLKRECVENAILVGD